MITTLVFAGAGGQGIILAGKLLCLASMKMGLEVTHIPSYGVEMRGGTANCSVVVADEPIPSPLVFHPDIACIFNEPSLKKFGPLIKSDGILIYNSSLIKGIGTFGCQKIIPLDANRLAEETAGSSLSANMVMLGALLALKPQLASLDAMQLALNEAVSTRHARQNEQNIAALLAGFSVIAQPKTVS